MEERRINVGLNDSYFRTRARPTKLLALVCVCVCVCVCVSVCNETMRQVQESKILPGLWTPLDYIVRRLRGRRAESLPTKHDRL